jgi:hypothetical protein
MDTERPSVRLQLLRIYQHQVVYGCTAVLLGLQDIQTEDDDRIWYGVQNLIIGAGNLSKTLWGTGRSEEERQQRLATRQPLRESLSITDESPLRRVKIRNDYEHLDERIEEWWDTSPNRNWVGDFVGPRGSIVGPGFGDKDILRWLDPTTGDVIFWGNELNIPTVVAEVQRLLPIAQAESRKPHWEPPNDQA